jgi:hypothetical protein
MTTNQIARNHPEGCDLQIGTIIINHQPPAIQFDQISDPARGSYFIE